MADGATAPDLEVAQHVDGDADGGGTNVEEDEVRHGRHGKTARGTEEDIYGHGGVAQAPEESVALITGHTGPGLQHGGNGERSGEDGRGPLGRLLEDLVLGRYATVLVAMTSTFANVLLSMRE